MKSTHKHVSNTNHNHSGLLNQGSELQSGTNEYVYFDCTKEVASSGELHVLRKNSNSKNTYSKPKTTVKKNSNLKHKIPSSKLIASRAKHRPTHKVKDWQWTPVINLSVNGKTLLALVDSGASHSLMATGKLKVEQTKIKSKTVQSIWKTCGSSLYLTNSTAKLEF